MRMILAASAAALVAGCAPVAPAVPSETNFADARTVGAAVDCIERNQILEARVRSGRVIDFHLRNGRVYRNILPNSCPGLTYQSFSYEPGQSRLCSIDLVTVRTGGVPGASCGLGTFQQIEGAGR